MRNLLKKVFSDLHNTGINTTKLIRIYNNFRHGEGLLGFLRAFGLVFIAGNILGLGTVVSIGLGISYILLAVILGFIDEKKQFSTRVVHEQRYQYDRRMYKLLKKKLPKRVS